MDTLHKLNSLPEQIKSCIINKFGSIDELYKNIFYLHYQEYLFYKSKNLKGIDLVKNKLFEIEEKLEDCGIEDGSDIIIEISSDFTGIIVDKLVSKLDEYLKSIGTDFETMRKWLEKQIN